MAFWTSVSQKQPKAQFRFFVVIPGLAPPGDETGAETIWYAKSVEKPGFELVDVYPDDYYAYCTENALKGPSSIPKLKTPLKMTLVDPSEPNLAGSLLSWLEEMGYNSNKKASQDNNINGSTRLYQIIKKVEIYQLGPGYQEINPGAPPEWKREDLEMWTLYNAYPAKVDFGSLTYDSDEFVEIQIDWAYEFFTVKTDKFDKEGYEFFGNKPRVKSEPLTTSAYQEYRRCHPEATSDSFAKLRRGGATGATDSESDPSAEENPGQLAEEEGGPEDMLDDPTSKLNS